MWTPTDVSLNEYKGALLAGVREVKMRVTALDANLNKISDDADITDDTVEGTVYVDADRATRRTCQLRIIDTNGKYTPRGASYESYGTNSFFYWDKTFKVEYGLRIGGQYYYVPLGIFMVDRVEVVAERGAAVINIDGSDLWKKITFSEWTASETIAHTQTINYTINKILTDAYPTAKIIVDPLTSRASNLLGIPFYATIGDNRGERLLSLLEEWSIDIFVDRNGNFVTRDKTQAPYTGSTSGPDFEFTAGENAVMLGVVKSQSGDTIKNHILVYNDKPSTSARFAEAFDGNGSSTSSKYYTNSGSPTSIENLGDRVMIVKAQTLASTEACLARAKDELAKNIFIEEEIRLPAIVNPLFDAYDTISIVETNSMIQDSYQLKAFDVPMQGSRQEMVVKKTRAL